MSSCSSSVVFDFSYWIIASEDKSIIFRWPILCRIN
jgi:hypothetical protein